MEALLFKKTFAYGKTKTISFLASALLIMLPAFSNAACIAFGVTFGNPQSNGGACVGKGVCRESMEVNPSGMGYLGAPEAVTVTFITNSANPNILMMRFSMSDLLRKQPEQAAAMTDPAGYSFDSPYGLGKSMFSPLALPAGSMVPPNVRFTVQISEDIVTIYIPYSRP